jgi:hypothetical protein
MKPIFGLVDGAELRILRAELLDAHRELSRLRVQNEQLIGSNRDLASMLSATDKRSGELVKIIVAFRRLLESESSAAALGSIEEILVNVIGTEDFVVLLITDSDVLRVVAGMGPTVERAHQVRPTIEELRASSERMVPLHIAEHVVGAIAIQGLLPHRDHLSANDDQVLLLLSRYAATAVMAAQHRKSWTPASVAAVA